MVSRVYEGDSYANSSCCTMGNDDTKVSQHTCTLLTGVFTSESGEPGNSDFSAFRQKFELVIKMNGWTYLEAANLLVSSLTGEAENCLSEVGCSEDLDNYELMMWLLKAWFCPEDQTEHFHFEFRERVQRMTEDATALGHALKQLGPRVFPTLPVVEVEKTIIKQFVDGLLDDQMCCDL